MIWATKLVGREEAQSIEFLFREQTASFDPGRQMLLVSVDEEWPMIRLWVTVPDPDLLAPYYGFVSCPRRSLPPAPVLLAGDRVRFGQIFHGG